MQEEPKNPIQVKEEPNMTKLLLVCPDCTGNALARVQRVGHHLLHPLIVRLLVLCAPAVLRPRALQEAPAPADPNS